MSDHDPYCQWPRIPCACADFAAVRAEEREHTAFLHEALLRNQLADLRAKVEALPPEQWKFDGDWVLRADVLALLDGGSDDPR